MTRPTTGGMLSYLSDLLGVSQVDSPESDPAAAVPVALASPFSLEGVNLDVFALIGDRLDGADLLALRGTSRALRMKTLYSSEAAAKIERASAAIKMWNSKFAARGLMQRILSMGAATISCDDLKALLPHLAEVPTARLTDLLDRVQRESRLTARAELIGTLAPRLVDFDPGQQHRVITIAANTAELARSAEPVEDEDGMPIAPVNLVWRAQMPGLAAGAAVIPSKMWNRLVAVFLDDVTEFDVLERTIPPLMRAADTLDQTTRGTLFSALRNTPTLAHPDTIARIEIFAVGNDTNRIDEAFDAAVNGFAVLGPQFKQRALIAWSRKLDLVDPTRQQRSVAAFQATLTGAVDGAQRANQIGSVSQAMVGMGRPARAQLLQLALAEPPETRLLALAPMIEQLGPHLDADWNTIEMAINGIAHAGLATIGRAVLARCGAEQALRPERVQALSEQVQAVVFGDNVADVDMAVDRNLGTLLADLLAIVPPDQQAAFKQRALARLASVQDETSRVMAAAHLLDVLPSLSDEQKEALEAEGLPVTPAFDTVQSAFLSDRLLPSEPFYSRPSRRALERAELVSEPAFSLDQLAALRRAGLPLQPSLDTDEADALAALCFSVRQKDERAWLVERLCERLGRFSANGQIPLIKEAMTQAGLPGLGYLEECVENGLVTLTEPQQEQLMTTLATESPLAAVRAAVAPLIEPHLAAGLRHLLP